LPFKAYSRGGVLVHHPVPAPLNGHVLRPSLQALGAGRALFHRHAVAQVFCIRARIYYAESVVCAAAVSYLCPARALYGALQSAQPGICRKYVFNVVAHALVKVRGGRIACARLLVGALYIICLSLSVRGVSAEGS